MKKLLIVLMTMTLVGFFAASSFADIVNSKHDLSSSNLTNGQISSNKNEICVFCHTPHNANTAVTEAPLWNHTETGETFTPYSSSTLTATVGEPNGISKLCLSCHDGATALDAFGAGTSFPGEGDDTLGSSGGSGHDWTNSNANLGTNLASTHPVSFTYDDALVSADGGLVAETDPDVAALLSADNTVECSSCHDVHDDTIPAFLVTSNENSALCLTCHAK